MPATPVDQLKDLLTKVPLSEEQQLTAAELVQKCSSQQLASLGLSAPARPSVPKMLDKHTMPQRLAAIQKVITSIEYNHKPGYMYNVSKDRPFCRIMDTAREVLREALPIKCIEAVFLGALLTAGWDGLQRLPMRFKSNANGQTYKHIVLVVHHIPSQKWGALGISRRQELMYKELCFDRLSDLVLDFKLGYEKWWHKLQKASVGLPFDHDVFSNGPVCWRSCNISPCKHPWETCASALNKFADEYKSTLNKFKVLGYVAPRAARTDPTQASAAAGGKAASGAPSTAAAAATSRRSASVSPTRRRVMTAKQHGGSPGTRRPVDDKAAPLNADGAHPSSKGHAAPSPVDGSGSRQAECSTDGVQLACAATCAGADDSGQHEQDPEVVLQLGLVAGPIVGKAALDTAECTSSAQASTQAATEGEDPSGSDARPDTEALASLVHTSVVLDSDSEDESDGDYDSGRE